jgi:hypothetical protein
MKRVHGSPEYARQDSDLTLAGGLAEYHAHNPGLLRGPDLSPEARRFFECHDIVHVVFGCGTSMPDEAVVKLASIFGTTAGLAVLRGYALDESVGIYRKLPPMDTLRAIMWAGVLVPRTVWRCLRQRRRWPWEGFQPYLQVPLRTLRADFGISVAQGR